MNFSSLLVFPPPPTSCHLLLTVAPAWDLEMGQRTAKAVSQGFAFSKPGGEQEQNGGGGMGWDDSDREARTRPSNI